MRNGTRIFGIVLGLAGGAMLVFGPTAACRRPARETAGVETPSARPVKPGLEVFLERYAVLVKGKKVGLITNPTGVDPKLRSDVELFAGRTDLKLAALFGPEHGVHVGAQAGETVSYYLDRDFGIPVFSLYRPDSRPAAAAAMDQDARMRSFDTRADGKRPLPEMLEGIEVMVFDIQDVGTRVYTYVNTMAYALEACAERGLPFIVLDRPNPIGGTAMEGPLLDPAFASFIGVFPVPLRHGMTAGELAMLYNDTLSKKAELTVVAMEGWLRDAYFDGTSLPWIFPSPNMPTLDTAVVYPGQVLIEGTNVSEGRGTTRPFELFGAPWIEGRELARALNGLGLAGAVFREARFTPSFSKFQGEPCGGCQLHVLDRNAFRPVETALHIIKTIRDMHPAEFRFHDDYFDKVLGTSLVRLDLEAGRPVHDIVAGWQAGLRVFAEKRKPYLLY